MSLPNAIGLAVSNIASDYKEAIRCTGCVQIWLAFHNSDSLSSSELGKASEPDRVTASLRGASTRGLEER